MNIEEYTTTPTADDTPRRNASQDAARAKRARAESEPIAPSDGVAIPRQWLVAALFGGMALFILALSWQLAQPARPLALTPVPTIAATEALVYTNAAPSVASQEAPTATEASRPPTFTPAPAEAAPAAPQTGRGLGAVATPEPPAPSYIENVGAQAEHCIRTCDGQPGPNGGDWALVPTAEPAMLEVIGSQVPHKIR